MTSDPLHVVPLGGLGEIGMNCLALDHGGDVVVIDCGVMFPDRELGVDVIHPDFSWLEARRDRVRAIVLTHGHEDHIGALPYLLRRLEAPIYGPPYTLALVRDRLREHEIDPPEIVPTRPRQRFTVGAFEIEPIRVTHSMPDATALVIRTSAGVVVHTGDFKIDPEPADGEMFDEARLSEVGDEGVLLLLSDSTNSWSEGESGPETRVANALEAAIRECKNRVVVSLFASNVHRVRALLDLARRVGRRPCLLGRSLRRHVETAVATGYLRDPGPFLVHPDDLRDVPRDQVLVLATGTQGEQRAALARIAEGRHPALALDPGDDVIISARIIPGSEQGVYSVINALVRRGMRVRFRGTDPAFHVSGHAHQGEQRRMIELVRPRFFVPVHGTRFHLERHATLARETGVERALVIENGAVLAVDAAEGPRVVDEVPVGRIHVDAGEEVAPEVLRDRALLAELGVALVALPVDGRGRLVGGPDVVTRGVVAEEEEPELVADASAFVEREIEGFMSRDEDDEAIEHRARQALKRFFGRRLGRKPLTYAMVVRVPS